MVKLLEPSASNESPINALMPPVSDTTLITLATPIIMPRVVRKLLIRLANMAISADRKLSINEKSIGPSMPAVFENSAIF